MVVRYSEVPTRTADALGNSKVGEPDENAMFAKKALGSSDRVGGPVCPALYE